MCNYFMIYYMILYIYIYILESIYFTFMSSIDLKVWYDECLQLFFVMPMCLMCIDFMGFSTGSFKMFRGLAGLLQPCCWLRGWGCQCYGPCLWVGLVAAETLPSKAQDEVLWLWDGVCIINIIINIFMHISAHLKLTTQSDDIKKDASRLRTHSTL